MNKEEFSNILNYDKKLFDEYICGFLDNSNILNRAIRYAVDGGKRIRPILFLETYKMLSENPIDNEIIEFAVCVEKIHAYSLIHDDLPCMDNDDYRRGRLSVHKKFGEDIALLAGDSLLNNSFESLLKLSNSNSKFLKASLYLAKSSGLEGMIKGQLNDIKKPETYDLEYVLDVYKNKTSRLFMASIVCPALILGLDEDKIKSLEDYSFNLGLSFQLEDDILDEKNIEELNILNVVNKKEALNILDKLNNNALKEINKFSNNEFHKFLINYLSNRVN